ncbi:MAG: MMPL family transporter [Nitrospirota bacterium]
MIRESKEYLQTLFGWWITFVQHHARTVVTVFFILTALVLVYSIKNFNINLDTSNMISSHLPFRKVEIDFNKTFPNLLNTLVLVVEAKNADLAVATRDRLTDELKKNPSLFQSVYVPGGGPFFEQNGLLYLNRNELEDFADNMAAAQPFIALLSQNMSLPGLFSVFGTILEHPEEGPLQDKRTLVLFQEMSRSLQQAQSLRPYLMPWQELMVGEKEMARQRKQFIIVRPVLDFSKLSSGIDPLESIRTIIRNLGLKNTEGVTVRITGDRALEEENLVEVQNSVGIATVASFFLVALILYVGLWRSGYLIASSLITLLVGLIWTTGFAVFFIGSLNMISITFAVLFIGLGIDYSIQFCLRFHELLATGKDARESGLITARGVGRGLLFSCVTTAIGFYSFLPTAYAGVTELGLIAGTGMFISFFANMTLLPAFLMLFPITKNRKQFTVPAFLYTLLNIPYTHSRTVIICSFLLGLGSLFFLPKVYFDYNPLNLYNPKSEAIQTIQDLFKDPETVPWTASVIVEGEREAKALAEKIGKLPEVNMAITIFDFIPQDQADKHAILSNVRLFMPQLDAVDLRHASCGQNMQTLNTFEKTMSKMIPAYSGGARDSLVELRTSIRKFQTLQSNPEQACKAFAALEQGMLSNLPGLFRTLAVSLSPHTVNRSDLPQELVEQYVANDGRYRIQVFPKENVIDRDALVRFVNALYNVTPNATDSPITVYESGMAIIRSFQMAVFLALIAITIFLLISMRSVFGTMLILMPLILAMLLTAATSVLFDIPLNFANVIVVPLLLGVGVHNGVLFALRYQTEPPKDGNMLKASTARAVLFSSLTMMISTGSLAFSTHRGIASIGILLTLCFGFLIFSTLILMPSLLHRYGNRLQQRTKNMNK